MMMSMFGSVTDAQVFNRELSDQEMIDITACRSANDKQGQITIRCGRNASATLTLLYFMFDWITSFCETGAI